eukprot:5165218-Amphidinium_carterae.1
MDGLSANYMLLSQPNLEQNVVVENLSGHGMALRTQQRVGKQNTSFATYATLGLQRGHGYPAIFYHLSLCLRVLIHGDDIVQTGDQDALDAFEKHIASRYDYKVCGCIGFGAQDSKQLSVLHRTTRSNGTSEEYSHDSKHVPILLKTVGVFSMQANTCTKASTDRRSNLTG